MNADAMAIMSRIKNSIKEVMGNGLDLVLPNFYASALSLIMETVVLTMKVANSLAMVGLMN